MTTYTTPNQYVAMLLKRAKDLADLSRKLHRSFPNRPERGARMQQLAESLRTMAHEIGKEP